jgi:PAS domain S-box-containing protein
MTYMQKGERDALNEELNKSGKIIDYIGQAIRKDRTKFWVSMNLIFLRDSYGNVIGTQGVVRDITERKESEIKLHESEEKFRLSFMTGLDAFYIATLDEGRIIDVNQVYYDVFGYTRDEVIGRTTLELNEYADLADREAMVAELKANGFVRDLELKCKKKDGKLITISSSLSVMMINNKAHTIGVIRDITERKQAEKDLKLHRDHLEELVKLRTAELDLEKEKAQSADRLKSAFLATMSHELRTPLNSIIGFTGIISLGLAGPINDEQKKQLQMVTNSSRHLLALINDVLDISKIEAGQFEINNELFDLEASIVKVSEIVMPFVKNKSVAFHIETAHGLGEIEGDSRRIEQILFNLLSNAIKFTEIGKIELTTELVPKYKFQRLPDKQAAIRFSVTDTGIGIQPEEIAKLFEPFYQIDSSLSRKFTGTGLGLAICRRLADLMDGEIFVESTWGKGSTFTFMLPHKKKFPK